MNYEKKNVSADNDIIILLSQFCMAIDRHLRMQVYLLPDCAVTLPIKMYYISMGLHRQRQVSLYIIIMLHYYIVDSDAVIGNGAAQV